MWLVKTSSLRYRCKKLNTLALLLSVLDVVNLAHPLFTQLIEWVKPRRLYAFWVVEALSTAFFAVEYGLRLWSASESRRFRGRLRFALRPLLLIDLASILPFFVILFLPSRDLTLRVLQIGWGIRHLKLLRYFRQWPAVKASEDELLQPTETRLMSWENWHRG